MFRAFPSKRVCDSQISASSPQCWLNLGLCISLLVMIGGLGLTYKIWHNMYQTALLQTQHKFDDYVDEKVRDIQQHMMSYQQVLRGAEGLFAASNLVEQNEFKTYVSRLKLHENFPCIIGLGFVQWIPAQDKQKYIQAMRQQGAPQFSILPAGERTAYAAISYVTDSMTASQGLDLLSDPACRVALEESRDSGDIVMSSKAKPHEKDLKHHNDTAVLLMPIYRQGIAHETQAQRRGNLLGWVYSPFLIDDMLRTLLGTSEYIDIEVYDGSTISYANLIYDADRIPRATSDQKLATSQFKKTKQINIAGHHWTIVVGSLPRFESDINLNKPRMIAIAGTVASLLLAVLSYIILRHGTQVFQKLLREKQIATSDLAFQQRALDAHISVLITDHEGTITHANTRTSEISGYKREELVGQNARLLNSGHHPAKFWENFWQVISSGQTWHGDICNRNKQGQLYWVRNTVVPYLNEAGIPIKYLALRTDITLNKQLEESLLEAKIAAESANKMKSAFLSNMSHEIRTPMNGVMGMLELLLHTKLDEEQRSFAKTIRDSGHLLLTVINDILDFSKIEAGKMDIEIVAYSLPNLMHGTVDMFKHLAEEKQLDLSLYIADNVPTALMGDPTRIRQILNNLISNAIKFTTQGTVTVNVSREHEKLRFAVQDTGLGLPAKAQQQIFESFVQADQSVTRKFGGSGLGLAICRQLATLMGGEIGVDSVVDQGSTFWFILPLQEAEELVELVNINSDSSESLVAQIPVVTPTTSEATAAGQLILLVEDNLINQKVATAILNRLGYAVHVVENGLLAVEAVKTLHYALVLMDCQMPVMDGFEATQTIRHNEKGKSHIPIIAMTADAMQGDRERCLKAGMDDYMTKPIDQKVLLKNLQRWMPDRKTEKT